MMPIQSGGDNDNLPTYIRRNNLYLSEKNTLLISGPSGTSNNPVGSGGADVIETEKSIEEGATEKSIIREKRVRILPPILSSLNRNGRPRFTLETVRTQGRLQILIVPNHFSEVIRTSHDGHRVSMELLETGALTNKET